VGNLAGPLAVVVGHEAVTATLRLEVIGATATPEVLRQPVYLPFTVQRLPSP
jgi:hypothetical protein